MRSLYLDNELTKVEMLEFEELLKFDSEVAQIFDSLKNTREVLRNTPKIKRRRSFILTPELSKQAKRQSGVLSGMRLVSTFSMILLLVVFTQNMLSDWSTFSSSDAAMSSLDSGAAEMGFMDTGDEISEKAITSDMNTAADNESAAPMADSEMDETNRVEEAVDCDAEGACDDAISVMSTDDAFGVTERATLPEGLEGAGDGGIEDVSPEGPADGGGGGDDDAAPEEIPVADEGLDSEQDDAEQESAVEDAVQEDETEATIVVTEVATEASVVEELEVATTDESVDTDGNTKLLIALALISVISSCTYLFLRKKYN